MSYEETVRGEARRHDWKVEVRDLEIGVTDMPCFRAPNEAGFCEIWVGIAAGTTTLHASHDWQHGAPHTANVRNLKDGNLYSRSGAPLTENDGVIRKAATHCTLSRKVHGSQYEDAWHALSTYIRLVYGLFSGERDIESMQVPSRPYVFEIHGDKTREAIEWRHCLAQERVAVIGLGGIGAWIADFVVKADAKEVHAWDYDCIEPKNLLRMPGGVKPCWIDKPKAYWFQRTYSLIHKDIHGHNVKVLADNVHEVVEGVSFAFVVVDRSNYRTMICKALANAKIPFVVAGLSPKREDNRARIYIRVVTGYTDVDSWEDAVPISDTGQDDYGTVDLPDVYAMAASWAIQAWRKMRGQFWQKQREECLIYRADEQSLTIRGVE